MAGAKGDSYQIALDRLRERLRNGVYGPGARITAVDLADELRLSATPVREALARLAGEGLIEERRGQGFFVRQLSAADVADLYRLNLAALLIAQEVRRPPRRPLPPAGALQADDPVRAVERLFLAWIAESGSSSLFSHFRTIQVQLGPVRRLEAAVLGDLAEEAARLLPLAAASRAERLAALRQFHGRRIRQAQRLVDLLQPPAAPAENRPDID